MIKDIEERKEDADSFRKWFADGWERNKGSIDDLIEHNKKMSDDIEYLLSEVKRYKEVLTPIADKSNWDKDYYGQPVWGGPTTIPSPQNAAKEALKEE